MMLGFAELSQSTLARLGGSDYSKHIRSDVYVESRVVDTGERFSSSARNDGRKKA